MMSLQFWRSIRCVYTLSLLLPKFQSDPEQLNPIYETILQIINIKLDRNN